MTARRILAPCLIAVAVSFATLAVAGPAVVYTEAVAIPSGESDLDLGLSRPTALASADFDEDGVPDLLCARADGDSFFMTLQRGNVDAIFPDAPGARQRMRDGTAVDSPFLATDRTVRLSNRAGFLAAGDFDGDGHADAVAAGDGKLELLPGDGSGGFGPAERIALPGSITAMVSGEINRFDGLPDFVVGVDGEDGPAVLVFQGPNGAWRRAPERIALPTPVTSLALVRGPSTSLGNLEIVTAEGGWLLEGRNRRLYYSHPMLPAVAAPVLREDAQVAARERSPGALALRLNRDALTDYVVIGEGSDPMFVASAIQATITVDSSGDNAIPGNGSCTLREAIINANMDGDLTGGDCAAGAGQDLIAFAIEGGGASATIVLTDPLPDVMNPATLDGATQGCGSPPCIVLNGSGTTSASGISLTGSGTTVRGFVIQDFDSTGVYIDSADNLVEGNFIGTDATGSTAVSNGFGVRISVASGNVIGGTAEHAGNLVSGNLFEGINAVLADGTQIMGNTIGTDVSGTFAIPNALSGIDAVDSDDLTIGGTLPGARNLISGNGDQGIYIRLDPPGVSTGYLIQGNYIGTGRHGDLEIGNVKAGIRAWYVAGSVFGGTSPNARNVLSNNGNFGIGFFGHASSENLILGNYIGVNSSGTLPRGNLSSAVYMDQGCSDNLVGGDVPGARNILSANHSGGVLTGRNGPYNVVAGNLIGLDPTGTVPLGNSNYGVLVWNGALTIIGGRTPGARNVIAATPSIGISVEELGSQGTVVQGNYIGTDVTGTVAWGSLEGIRVLNADGIKIGGTEPGAGNLISGHDWTGLDIELSVGTEVAGNLIGTDVTGTQALGNGVGLILDDALQTIVGGVDPAARNVISGNLSSGLFLRDDSFLNRVTGNFIGTDVTGTKALANDGDGVVIEDSSNNTIGGTTPGMENVIAYNTKSGVAVSSGTGNMILGNSIHDNLQLGIDLGGDGVTANDTTDPDIGPNGLQNYPTLSEASATPAGVTISGTLDTLAGVFCRVDFFAGQSCDGSGHGEGARYLGYTEVTTSPVTGIASFNPTLPAPVSDGDAITSTATLAGNTSEFSSCTTAVCSVLATFAPTLVAPSPNALTWGVAQDVRWAQGDLALVGSYATTDDGTLLGQSGMDISGDQPAAGGGIYYVVRPLGCGSWQTTAGTQPGRDVALP